MIIMTNITSRDGVPTPPCQKRSVSSLVLVTIVFEKQLPSRTIFLKLM